MEQKKIPQYTLIRSKRRTIAVELRPTGMIVRAPLRLRQSQIDKFLKQKEAWILEHWKVMQERCEKMDIQEPFTAEELREAAEIAKKTIPERVKYYAQLIGVEYGRITIRCQRTRWGSCTSDGNLNFNCLLTMMPQEAMDCVIVHELCHRKHMNHSGQFYAEMGKVFPEYEKWHKWLKEYGSVLLSRVPRVSK